MQRNKGHFIGLGILQLFVSIGAIAAGIGFLVDPSGAGLGMTTELLNDSPFSNFLIPGICLLGINGIGNLIGAVLSFTKHEYASVFGLIFGLALIIWIVAQVYWIGLVSWMQPLFFVLGVIELIVGYRLLVYIKELKTKPAF